MNTTVYATRYQANKDRKKGVEVVVKVEGGYMILTYAEYSTWRGQK